MEVHPRGLRDHTPVGIVDHRLGHVATQAHAAQAELGTDRCLDRDGRTVYHHGEPVR